MERRKIRRELLKELQDDMKKRQGKSEYANKIGVTVQAEDKEKLLEGLEKASEFIEEGGIEKSEEMALEKRPRPASMLSRQSL